MPLKEEFRRQGDFLFKYRSYLPIFILLIGLAVFLLELNKGRIFESSEFRTIQYLGLVVSLCGLFIRFLSIGYAAENTSGRNTSEGQIADTVNKTGLYSICRHPLYVGNFFMWLGIAIWTHNPWFVVCFILFYYLYYERIMYAEEEFLREKYGKEYVDWATVTPPFIPKLSSWKSSSSRFNFKKIIRQEKAGILNLFLVFFIFSLTANVFLDQGIEGVKSDIWTLLFGIALLYYILIKALQKLTKVLS